MPSSARYAKFWSLVVFLTIVTGLSTAQSEPGNTVTAQSEPGDTAPSLGALLQNPPRAHNISTEPMHVDTLN